MRVILVRRTSSFADHASRLMSPGGLRVDAVGLAGAGRAGSRLGPDTVRPPLVCTWTGM